MLDIKSIRHNPKWHKEMLTARGYNPETIDLLLSKDQNRRSMIEANEKSKKHRNEVSKDIGKKKASGESSRQLIEDMKTVSASIKEHDEKIKTIEADIHNLIMSLPNIPHDSVSKDIGTKASTANTWSTKIPTSSLKEYKTHWEIGQGLSILDYSRGKKLTDTSSVYFKDQGARLMRAVTNYILDRFAQYGDVEEVVPPYFINELANIPMDLSATDEKSFGIKRKDLSLVTKPSKLLLSLFSDLILDEKDIPQYLVTSVPCFQSRDALGNQSEKDISLLTQSNIIEILVLSKAETSLEELEKWTDITQAILEELNLPHRTTNLPIDNLLFSASKTYDIEVWMPSQKSYKILTSCTYSSDFLTRRFNIRYRNQSGQVKYLHSLNGFGFKVEALLAAILENYQQVDGSIKIPKVLLPYMGGIHHIQHLD